MKPMAKLYPQITPFCLFLIDISGVGHKTNRWLCKALVIMMIIRPQNATNNCVRAIKYNFSFLFVNIAGTIKYFTVFGEARRTFAELCFFLCISYLLLKLALSFFSPLRDTDAPFQETKLQKSLQSLFTQHHIVLSHPEAGTQLLHLPLILLPEQLGST